MDKNAVKLGFWIGVGFLLLGLVLGLLRWAVSAVGHRG